MAEEKDLDEKGEFMPYQRDEDLVRRWALPGMKGFENRIGGLEKENLTGNVSYDPENHQLMSDIRAEKVEKIKDFIPVQELDSGSKEDEMLLVGWGSTYGVLKTASQELRNEGLKVAHLQIKYLNPFPKGLEELLKSYENVVVVENNKGQLEKILRSTFNINVIAFNKITGLPFGISEIKEKVYELKEAVNA